MNQYVSVLLADDHDIVVEGIRVLLDAERDLEVVALARDAHEAVRALRAHRPDVVVVDARLPGGVDEILRATRSLALVEHPDGEVAAWLERGADAVLSKQVSAGQLAHAIRALAEGRTPAPSAPAPPAPPLQPREQPREQPPRRDSHFELLLRSLSRREREILSLLMSGYSNRRIAEECVLSLNTVRAHVQNVLIKLGVHSKLEAATFAMRQGGPLAP